MQSGIIDVEMYKLLLSADIVVADISTSNANAIYELGVRHALKKGTTIIMSEKSAVLHFDLNHIATLQYEHLGDDIGCSEARRIKEQLKSLMEAVLNETRIDSPVYTYLPDLNTPTLTAKEIKEIVRDSDEVEKEWGVYSIVQKKKLKLGDFSGSKGALSESL